MRKSNTSIYRKKERAKLRKRNEKIKREIERERDGISKGK